MSRNLLQRLLLIVCLIAGLVSPASAHDGSPRLELSVDRINPGAVLEIRGINLASDVLIVVTLWNGETGLPLGQALSDSHGDFTLIVELPRDLAAGDYTVWANNSVQAPLSSATLRIEGAAVPEKEEDAAREEEDGLLSAMPQSKPAAVAPPAHAPAAPSAQAAVTPSNLNVDSSAWLVLPVGTLAIAGLALVLRRRSLH